MSVACNCRNLINKLHIRWSGLFVRGYFNATRCPIWGKFYCWCLVPSIICDTCRLAKIKFILCPCVVLHPPQMNIRKTHPSYSLLTEPETIRLNFNGDFSYCYSFPTSYFLLCDGVFLSVFLSSRRSHSMPLSVLLFVGSWKHNQFRIQYSTRLPFTFTLRTNKKYAHTHTRIELN